MPGRIAPVPAGRHVNARLFHHQRPAARSLARAALATARRARFSMRSARRARLALEGRRSARSFARSALATSLSALLIARSSRALAPSARRRRRQARSRGGPPAMRARRAPRRPQGETLPDSPAPRRTRLRRGRQEGSRRGGAIERVSRHEDLARHENLANRYGRDASMTDRGVVARSRAFPAVLPPEVFRLDTDSPALSKMRVDGCRRPERGRGAMNRVRRIACIGECMIELSGWDPAAGTARVAFAGDVLNTAVYLARLLRGRDIDLCFVSVVGTDGFSDRMVAEWEEEGIDCRFVGRHADRLPGLYAIETDAAGERFFRYWRGESAARTLFAGPGHGPGPGPGPELRELAAFDAIYLSGVTLAVLAPAVREGLVECARALRARGGGRRLRRQLPAGALAGRGNRARGDGPDVGAFDDRTALGRRRGGAPSRVRSGSADRRARCGGDRRQARRRRTRSVATDRQDGRLPRGRVGHRHDRGRGRFQRRLHRRKARRS